MGEGAVDESAIAALADDLSANRLDIGHAVETVLRSRAFFAPANLGSRVVGPVEFVIGACRALVPERVDAEHADPGRLDDPARAGVVRAAQRRRLARGRAWLTARSLVARANFAAALVEGRPVGLPAPLDAGSIAAEQGLGRSAARVRRGCLERCLLGHRARDRKASG